jgi:hypothetical protein
MQKQDIFNFKSHHRLKHINILKIMKKKILKYYFKLLKSLCKSIIGSTKMKNSNKGNSNHVSGVAWDSA